MSTTGRQRRPHATPRYLEIEQALREEIAKLQPGDPLPSDAEVCDRFGVSRMTARNGVQRLADAGLVTRVPGQGTFVAELPIHRRAGRLLSFSEDMRGRGLSPHSRILRIDHGHPTPEEQAALDLSGDDAVTAIRRLRLANNIPMATERAVLPRNFAAAILTADLENGSMHAALEQIGRVPAFARGHLAPQSATSEDAELLEIAGGAPLLVERRTIYDPQKRPLEVTETRYSPSRYVFEIELVRDVASGLPTSPNSGRPPADAA